ncbi:helix-turn-helix domain-containing protein [Empedobacter falsenii]|uniref:helix-turn-helix domain-containing protein n=1 Tax=Empedobacter falsenii TaxID=343874 RepID=UPI002575BF5A|nr:helix-turn-helix domain-containing protein [Empedobacter falsenii]MDM1299846.1 helix-turn-helix domain-containing protein [Empedobacter falsenii]MDM1319652.1 helix-turn-helix domain-containing protein [Empedobacter falsenii]
MSNLLYTHSKKDLEAIVEIVIERLRKMDISQTTKDIPEDDRLTQKEAAKLLNISVVTLIDWKKKGLVPFYQVQRSIFYSKKELIEIAQKNRNLFNKK